MISKKTKKVLLEEDESERKRALEFIKRMDSKDIDFLVQTTWSFDQSYLQAVVQQIARVRNEKSASAISTILFACTEKSQDPIRIKCIDALAQNSTEPATEALVNVAKNQKFYSTQCHAVRKLGTRQREQRIVMLLHGIVEEGQYTPTTDEAKRDPHRLVLCAFEALSSESLRNEESAKVILEKTADPGCQEIYRQKGVKYLAQMGFQSTVDPALDKIEQYLNNTEIVFPLFRLLTSLKGGKQQKQRVHQVIGTMLPTVNPRDTLNADLVGLMKATLDEDLIDILTAKTCTWELNGPAGGPIVEMLRACPKESTRTIKGLLRYADTPQWSVNKQYVLPNLNASYLENPLEVVREIFESDIRSRVECRDFLRQQQNTPTNREAMVKNICDGIEAFVQDPPDDKEEFNRYLSQYFGELGNIVPPLLKDGINENDWRLATNNCVYRLVKLSSKANAEKRSAISEELTKLIDHFFSNPRTGSQVVEKAINDWLVRTRTRTPAKYMLMDACAAEKHRSNAIRILIRRAAGFHDKGGVPTDEESLYQKWVSENVVARWEEEAKPVLDECLVENDEFNAWAYETLRVHDLLDCSIVVRGLTSKISDLYTMRLLEDLIPRYSADAENILVQKIRHGRPAKIRASGTTAAGAIFDYDVNPNCPNTVLGAVHERFSEQSREVREAAYVSLGKICSAESIDVLQKAKAKDTKLESVIKQSLDNIFARFSEAKPSEDNVDTTIAWIKVIGKLADKRGFEKLKPYVDPESYHRDEAVRIAAVAAMGLVGTSEHIAFLEELRQKESHFPELTREIDRAIGFISNIGDFKLLDVVRQLTDDDPAFSDLTLDLSTIFGKRAQSIKNHCFQAYKAWNSQDYSLYVTQLDNVCDLLGKTIIDVFRNELFGGNEKRYVSVKTSDSPENRYNLIKGKFDSVTGSCFIIIHALRVKAPIAHPEDSKTEQPKRELSSDEGELAKENFINAVTKSVEKLRDKVLPTHGHATF